jgi:hypothetical protein
MKPAIVFSALLLTTTLAAGAAHADPQTESSYVAVNATAGGDSEAFFAGPQVEVGERLTGIWFAHGVVLAADETHLWTSDEDPASHRIEAGGGIEARPCTRHGHACLDAGVDLRVRDEATTGAHPTSVVDPIAVERLGADVGTHRIRFRGAVEAINETHAALGGLDVTGGVAVAF